MRPERENHLFAKCSYDLEATGICSQPCLDFWHTADKLWKHTPAVTWRRKNRHRRTIHFIFRYCIKATKVSSENLTGEKKWWEYHSQALCPKQVPVHFLQTSSIRIYSEHLVPFCLIFRDTSLEPLWLDSNILHVRQISITFKLLSASKNANFNNHYMPSLPKIYC